MSEKEWNLKNKEQCLDEDKWDGAKWMAYCSECIYDKSDEQYYSKEDIEILRNKLIKDMEELCGFIFTKVVYDVNIPTITNIINKRFGKNE